jgi:uncharacterized protein (DUF305 family)
MKISILFLAIGLLTSNSCKNDEEENTQMDHSMSMENQLMQSMNETSKTMNNAKMNGDFDYDFANLMIMHHQMAIDMSAVEIKIGSNQKIKEMANGIIAAQEIEIKEMQEFLINYKIPNTNNQTSNSYKIAAEMKAMMDKMNQVEMSNNVDENYVAMMIPHHLSAVSMAKQQLEYGNQAILLELAKNIIEDQSFEINEFIDWQAKN